MKNLFLYYNSDYKHCEKMNNLNDIFLFKSKKLIAVDKDVYDKKERLELQKKLYIQPYYTTQRIFKELIISILEQERKFRILDISFEDEELEAEEEYLDLLDCIRFNNGENILSKINIIFQQYDTEISSIVFVYENRKFSLTNTGILNVEDSDEIFTNFLNDKNINKNLLGLT